MTTETKQMIDNISVFESFQISKMYENNLESEWVSKSDFDFIVEKLTELPNPDEDSVQEIIKIMKNMSCLLRKHSVIYDDDFEDVAYEIASIDKGYYQRRTLALLGESVDGLLIHFSDIKRRLNHLDYPNTETE